MVENLRNYLRQRIETLCLLTGDFTLTTGQKSKFYFDCKRATLDGECLSLISEHYLERIESLPERPTAIGGLTMGADFIVAGIIQKAFESGMVLSGSIVRKTPKAHGTCSLIENEFDDKRPIVVVDDVFTSGKSTLQACAALGDHGYRIVGVIGLVDREQGGIENIRKQYDAPVSALFRKSDFPVLRDSDKA